MSNLTRRLYVCFNCYTAYCHPIQHCYNCPGKLVPRDYPYDFEKARKRGYKMEDFTKWLDSLGLKSGGV